MRNGSNMIVRIMPVNDFGHYGRRNPCAVVTTD